MPGLARRNDQYNNASFGFWSKHSDDVSCNQLQKFWSELTPQARQELLRIDKQALFEQARKNMYCSRCNGLLLEVFLQIVMHGKSLQQDGAISIRPCKRTGVSKNQNDGGSSLTSGLQEETQDPSLCSWGGLTTTRDGSLTILDCYLYSTSLNGLQNVFDSAQLRERERELLYPDACGGGGHGWISQGIASYGRGHGTRETCALHTARLSCDTLLDFWSALGEETRQSLLRMKEEDFIEKLMYRFDSKRFCRDCRRNVIREFKELKELKRMRREPRCTSWFCVPDTAFQYEVSDNTVQADWCQTFADTVGTYHLFEWAIGTGEGKCDIMEFENVGMNGSVQVNGLDLGGLSACYITLRAWKLDGRCTELSVKAHALKGQQCVHYRLVVGDGYVAITRGESIRRFFEHAEEVEEEEDDDSMDKDGNELDGECSRPQKHAKSPELAREFLLDAATVIFKEQVEKAFREGTARQNAHSIFVCLALKLLEERIHVACKEIITLEKQMKLLEEEEKERHEEEERKERRRTKEREKKLRRRERLKEKEKEKEKRCLESNHTSVPPDISKKESLPMVEEEPSNIMNCRDSVSEIDEINLSRSGSPHIQEEFLNDCTSSLENHSFDGPDSMVTKIKDGSGSFTMKESKFSHWRFKVRKETEFDPSLKWSNRRRFATVSENGPINRSDSRYQSVNFEVPSRGINGSNRQLRINSTKSNSRTCAHKYREKFQCSNNKGDRYESYSCSCSQQNEYRAKGESHVSATRAGREPRSVSKSESALDMSRQGYHSNKYNQVEYMREGCGRVKGKIIWGNNSSGWDLHHQKKVWGPTESQKYPWSNSDSDVALRSSTFNVQGVGPDNNIVKSSGSVMTSGDVCSGDASGNSSEINQADGKATKSRNSSLARNGDCQNELREEGQDSCISVEASYEEDGLSPARSPILNVSSNSMMGSTSNSDNCSSCLSEGDSNTASSNIGNMDSSLTSDSEDASQQSDVRDASLGTLNGFYECQEQGMDKKQNINGGETLALLKSPDGTGSRISGNMQIKTAANPENGISTASMGVQHHSVFTPMHNQHTQFPVDRAPSTMGYYHQNPVTWPATPANGLMTFPHSNHYLYAGPLGYGLNGNSHICMQYSSLPHLNTPLFNPGPVPVCQPVSKANGFHSGEQTQISKPVAAKETPVGPNSERVIPAKMLATETAACGEGGQTDNSAKLQMGNNSFSLFHFDGPIALSTGCKSNFVHSKDGILGELSSQLSADHVDNGHASSKKETRIEEYNLFATSNGITFSFF
ncbi:hypothetical protein SLA2020_128660 [Shorea laevis]